VPIDLGGEDTGHAGRLGSAALDLQTGETTVTPRVNLSAGRATYDVTDTFYVGAIATQGTRGLRSNPWRLDAGWHSSRSCRTRSCRSVAGRALARRSTPGRRDVGLQGRSPNDLWRPTSASCSSGDVLIPPRIPASPGHALVRLLERESSPGQAGTGAFAWIRQAFSRRATNRWTISRPHRSRVGCSPAPFKHRDRVGHHFEVNWVPTYSSSPGRPPFEIAPGVVGDAGGYHFTPLSLSRRSGSDAPRRIGHHSVRRFLRRR